MPGARTARVNPVLAVYCDATDTPSGVVIAMPGEKPGAVIVTVTALVVATVSVR